MSTGGSGETSGPEATGGHGATATATAKPPRNQLHPAVLIAMAWRTARMEPARVIVPAFVIFGLGAIEGTFFTEIAVDHLGLESIAGVFVFGASTLGLTFYAGMLERLVGSVERGEPAQPIFVVLRTLPWWRLLLAQAILLVLGAVASLVLVVPGLIVGTVFALVGPLINLLDASVPDAFKRSLKLVWPQFMLVFCFITLPLAVEHEVVVLVADLIPHEHIWAVFLTTFILGVLFGMALGLMEVTLAERLVSGAQGPGADLLSTPVELLRPVDLPDPHSGQSHGTTNTA